MEIYGGMPAFNSSLLVEVKQDGGFTCFFHAAYPVLVQNLNWKILSKKLVLTTLDFKNGVAIFWLDLR